MKVEVNDLKELIERGDIGLGEDSGMAKLEREIEEIKLNGAGRADDEANQATTEAVDRKIKDMLEQLKENNQVIWKGTVEKAEKVFNLQGIEDTLDLMPDVLQGKNQLKTTINILDDRYGEQNTSQPKPQINTDPEDKK